MLKKTVITLALSLSVGASVVQAQDSYEGSRFSDVWGQVVSDPATVLPQVEVTPGSLYQGFRNLLLESSRRTIESRADVLPQFNKLLHPNGVCMKGTWNITETTPYTGYFSQGSEALIIARASAALSNTKRGENRAFGLAGKLYPTTDENHEALLETANFFTIEDLGGTRRDFFLDADNTNDIIRVSPTLTAFFNGLVGLNAGLSFAIADESNFSTALIRELYPIAELGLAVDETSHAPMWLRIRGSEGVPRVVADDFRDELAIGHYPGGLMFDIEVASEGSRLGERFWQKIGYILMDDSVVSNSCDHRLHFSHPKSRVRQNVLDAIGLTGN